MLVMSNRCDDSYCLQSFAKPLSCMSKLRKTGVNCLVGYEITDQSVITENANGQCDNILVLINSPLYAMDICHLSSLLQTFFLLSPKNIHVSILH